MKRITRANLNATKSHERTLLFGPMGTGKTTAMASLVLEFPDDRIWIVDTDAGYDKILREWYPDSDNFEVLEVNDMKELSEALDIIDAEAKPDDWIGIDKLDDAWSWAQDAWSAAQTGNEHIMQYLMQKNTKDAPALKEAGKRAPIFAMDQLETWPAINFMHNFLFMDRLKRMPFNIMALAGVRDKTEGLDDEMKTIFKGIKAMPGGQKHNTHRFDTIALMQADLTGELPRYTYTTLKDRGKRKLVKDKRWSANDGFWKGYKENYG